MVNATNLPNSIENELMGSDYKHYDDKGECEARERGNLVTSEAAWGESKDLVRYSSRI